MKLSQLKSSNIRKRIQLINGEIKEVLINEQVNGYINFYEINKEKLSEVIDKIGNDDVNDFMMYKAIPYMSDIECDVTYDEFKLMLENPSDIFTVFIEELIISINKVLTIDSKLSKSSANLSDNNITKIENNISKEADLDNLYEQLGKTSDREKRKELIKRITEIQKE